MMPLPTTRAALPGEAGPQVARRWPSWRAFVVVCATLLVAGWAIAWFASEAAHADFYSEGDAGDQIAVQWYKGTSDVVLWQRVDESDTEVVIDIRLVPLPVPSNAMAEIHTTTFDLSEPLGDRVVKTADGAFPLRAGD